MAAPVFTRAMPRGCRRKRGRIADAGNAGLGNILSSLDVPELEPVPARTRLTKTFYLCHSSPAGFNSGQTLVETFPRDEDEEASSPVRPGAATGLTDYQSPPTILAVGWAIRLDGQPMLPADPGAAQGSANSLSAAASPSGCIR